MTLGFALRLAPLGSAWSGARLPALPCTPGPGGGLRPAVAGPHLRGHRGLRLRGVGGLAEPRKASVGSSVRRLLGRFVFKPGDRHAFFRFFPGGGGIRVLF